MAKDDIGLIEPDEIAYRLELTPSELSSPTARSRRS
jgi:hypothetical protein